MTHLSVEARWKGREAAETEGEGASPWRATKRRKRRGNTKRRGRGEEEGEEKTGGEGGGVVRRRGAWGNGDVCGADTQSRE
jgi:hypothetical protein